MSEVTTKETVTLAEMANALEISVEHLRKLRYQAKDGFPSIVEKNTNGYLYDKAEFLIWAAKQPIRGIDKHLVHRFLTSKPHCDTTVRGSL